MLVCMKESLLRDEEYSLFLLKSLVKSLVKSSEILKKKQPQLCEQNKIRLKMVGHSIRLAVLGPTPFASVCIQRIFERPLVLS